MGHTRANCSCIACLPMLLVPSTLVRRALTSPAHLPSRRHQSQGDDGTYSHKLEPPVASLMNFLGNDEVFDKSLAPDVDLPPLVKQVRSAAVTALACRLAPAALHFAAS